MPRSSPPRGAPPHCSLSQDLPDRENPAQILVESAPQWPDVICPYGRLRCVSGRMDSRFRPSIVPRSSPRTSPLFLIPRPLRQRKPGPNSRSDWSRSGQMSFAPMGVCGVTVCHQPSHGALKRNSGWAGAVSRSLRTRCQPSGVPLRRPKARQDRTGDERHFFK